MLICAVVCATVMSAFAADKSSLGPQQENGSNADSSFNSGAQLAVIVHDASGSPIAATAVVHVYRQGITPSGLASTSDGRAMFVLTPLGDFTVVVEAAGYQTARKDVSLPTAQRAQIDIFLRRDLSAGAPAGVAGGVPGRPVLAPKAKEAFEKGLQALSAEKLGNAEIYVGEAMRLAPGHPDVLYVRGVLYLKQGKFAAAQGTLEKASQLDPGHARAYAALGMALLDQGKYETAIAPLEKALQLDAAVGWEAQWSLAKACYRVGRYDEALKTSQGALEGSKGKAPQIALLVAQSLTAVGRYEEAAAMLRGFAKEHGDRAEATTARRWLQKLEASGKVEASREEARKQ
jgi:tetratricopeptide (TPR) repeat protein